MTNIEIIPSLYTTEYRVCAIVTLRVKYLMTANRAARKWSMEFMIFRKIYKNCEIEEEYIDM